KSPTASPHKEIIESFRSPGTYLELWGPVKILVPINGILMEDWFFMEEWQLPERPIRDRILRIEFALQPDDLDFQLISHSTVWSDVPHADSIHGGSADTHKSGAWLAATVANVHRLFRATREFLREIECRKVRWSELNDGERPDRGSLM